MKIAEGVNYVSNKKNRKLISKNKELINLDLKVILTSSETERAKQKKLCTNAAYIQNQLINRKNFNNSILQDHLLPFTLFPPLTICRHYTFFLCYFLMLIYSHLILHFDHVSLKRIDFMLQIYSCSMSNLIYRITE